LPPIYERGILCQELSCKLIKPFVDAENLVNRVACPVAVGVVCNQL